MLTLASGQNLCCTPVLPVCSLIHGARACMPAGPVRVREQTTRWSTSTQCTRTETAPSSWTGRRPWPATELPAIWAGCPAARQVRVGVLVYASKGAASEAKFRCSLFSNSAASEVKYRCSLLSNSADSEAKFW